MYGKMQEIKEDIMKTCHKYIDCEDCPYHNAYTGNCQIIYSFLGEQTPCFTPEMIFVELFKTAIKKNCGVEESCNLCKNIHSCKYCTRLPVRWED